MRLVWECKVDGKKVDDLKLTIVVPSDQKPLETARAIQSEMSALTRWELLKALQAWTLAK